MIDVLNTVLVWGFWGGIQYILIGATYQMVREKNVEKALLSGFMASVWALAFFGSVFWGWTIM